MEFHYKNLKQKTLCNGVTVDKTTNTKTAFYTYLPIYIKIQVDSQQKMR